MWPTSKGKHFEPIEHFFLIKWFLKKVFYLTTLPTKISKLWNFCMIWFFIKFIQRTCTFIEGGIFLLYKRFEIYCMILCFPFYYFFKNVLRHLIPLIYKTQNDIYIISKLFLKILYLKRHHFIYCHTTIHYDYNNVRLTKSKVVFCNLFLVKHSLLVPNCGWTLTLMSIALKHTWNLYS
jgi:hypothetical protein